MIFSSIHATGGLDKYPKAIQTAVEYLKSHDFMSMETGVYEIQGKDLFAQVMDAKTEPAMNKRPEVHKRYVDVQFLVSGSERIGVTPDTGAYELAEAVEEKDLYFYKAVENETFIEAVPGCYSIFFPDDVHRPAVAAGDPETIRKVVVKVSMELI